MSTYFTAFPLTVPFPLLSEALQTSVYWEPSLSVSVSVLNATSPAIAKLRADSEVLDESFRAEYEAMRDFFIETLDKFQGTDPEIDDYIARIYTTFLEQNVDTDVYGEPVEWSMNSFTNSSRQYLLDEVEWFQHLPESKREDFIFGTQRLNQGSSNYFYGLASAYNTALRRVISKRRSDWDLWREVPKLQEMYARIQLFRDQMQVRNSLRGENSEEIRRLEEAMRVELSQALLALVTSRFSFDLTWEAYSPTGRYSNHMAYIETKITNPVQADEIASQVELEVDNNSLNILTALQDDFPQYEIPLEVPTRAYNQTGMVSNLHMSRNGQSSDYPVRDAITGRYLWVGGDEYYTSIRRYGGNGPAVDSMETFFEYVFPDTRLVSEYEDEYSLAGRGDELEDYVDEYNRYQALATGQGELQEGDELYVVDGEFDLEAAINGLNEYYGYYGSVEAVMELQFTGTGLYTMPLEELYEDINRYDDAMEEDSGATPFTLSFESETFKTQQSESYVMEDASRPFFDPESEGPYELSGSPSGSEVSYGAERIFGPLPSPQEWKLKIYLSDLLPVDKSNLGDFCEGVAERLNRLAGKVRNSERPLYDARMKDYNTKEGFEELAFDLEDFAMDFEQISEYREFSPDYQYDTVDMNMADDILDRMYNWGDSFKTMWIDTSSSTNDFSEDGDFTALWYDRYSLSAEQEMKGRVRTMTGRPRKTRKLVKDQDITPEEAAKRVKLEAEISPDIYSTAEEAMARAKELGCSDIHSHEMDGRTVYMPCITHERYQSMRYNEMTSSRHVYGAEDKKDDTVISTREESGITTETRQYKKKKYNPEKMKKDIPAEVLDQTDSDDLWVAFAFGILGMGIGAAVTNMGWMKRIRGD